jgi:hypothetical protein
MALGLGQGLLLAAGKGNVRVWTDPGMPGVTHIILPDPGHRLSVSDSRRRDQGQDMTPIPPLSTNVPR